MNGSRYKSLWKFTGAVFLLMFCLVPFIWMVIISLNQNPDFLMSSSGFELTLENFTKVLTNDSVHLYDYIINSMVISLVSAALATITAALSAYAVTRFDFPGKITIPLALLAFSMFPQIAIVGYLFDMMTFAGWINTYAALIFPYITIGLPLALWMMISYLGRISTELDEAALVDGASRGKILFKIILPVSLPGLFSTFIMVFIYSFNEFLFALMLTVDYNARTVPVGIAMFEGLHGQIPWGEIMAAALIAMLPMIIVIAFFQKYVIEGLTEGALKG